MATSSTLPRTPMLSKTLIPWLAFASSVCITVGLFFVPAFIIRPFRFQSPRGLVLAMAVRQVAPFWTLVTLAASILLAIVLWRRVSRWKKPVVAVGLFLALSAAVMSRIDYFEWMFHPVPVVGFESAQATKLDPSDMVLAVRFGSDARAYPIRAMAYHHVVNDVVAGVPIAVTY